MQLVARCFSSRTLLSTFCWSLFADLAHVRIGRLSPRNQRTPEPSTVGCLLCPLPQFTGIRSPGTKTAGGDLVLWVGFELLHSLRQLGISARKAEWFVRWTKEVSEQKTVHVTTYEGGLGVMCVASAPEHERLFLTPLYTLMALHPQRSTRTVLFCVSHSLTMLVRTGTEYMTQLMCRRAFPFLYGPRVGAQASAQRTWTGGWLPVIEPDRTLDKWSSTWSVWR